MEVFFVVAVAVAVTMVVVPMIRSYQRQTNAAWGRAAELLGVSYHPGSLLQHRNLQGDLHGCYLIVDTHTQSSGKNSKTYTRFRLRYPRPLGLGLQLSQQGFFASITKLFGAQDIEVGDPTFDSATLIKGRDPRQVHQFLTPARRLRIHHYLSSFPQATIGDSEIFMQQLGVVRNTESIVAAVRAMSRVAWHLTGDRAEDQLLQEAMNAQDEGRPADALRILQATAKVGNSEIVQAELAEEQLLEGEILQLAGRRQEAAERFAEAQRQAPQDPEISEWARSSAALPGLASPPVAEPVPEPAMDAAMDAAAFCQSVFGNHRSSFAANELFERQYAGQEVHWSGKLLRVESLSYDLVFGDRGGWKATLEVQDLPQSSYWSRSVKAFVQITEEAASALRQRVGQPVRIRGRLLKLDAFMRNVYVAEGQVTD